MFRVLPIIFPQSIFSLRVSKAPTKPPHNTHDIHPSVSFLNAVDNNDHAQVKRILDEEIVIHGHIIPVDRFVNEIHEDFSESALMMAAQNNNVDLMQTLLQCKADPDAESSLHGCPLVRCIHLGNIDAGKVLLADCCNVNKAVRCGPGSILKTPLVWAAECDSAQADFFVRMLLDASRFCSTHY